MSRAARDDILGQVRAAVANADGRAADAMDLVTALPRRASDIKLPIAADIVAHFLAKAEANLMTIERVATLDDVPAAVTRHLANSNFAADISVAPILAKLSWPTMMTVRSAKARLEEKVTVTRAVAGIAETGTLVCCSGDEAPSSLTFAGEASIIVVAKDGIVPRLEDGIARVKTRQGAWPRTVNLVSGPSRTADVAGIVVRPAHGPKQVHLLVVG